MSAPAQAAAGPVAVQAALVELVARDAAAAETGRELTPQVVAALREAGFRRHLVPRAYGGAGGSFGDLTRAVAAIGAACASTAWCASVGAHLARMASFLPGEGAREVWAEGPDAVLAGSLIPGGTADPVAGGWRLSGRWPYVSAVQHADWALLCVLAPASGPAEALMVAVPRKDLRVEDTWSDVGMRATGSHTAIVENVVVPEHRAVRRAEIIEDRRGGVPLRAVNALSFAGPALGAARGMLAAWRGVVAAKAVQPAAARVPYDAVFARASGEVDAAGLLLERVAAVADAGTVTPELEVRNLRDCALAADVLTTAAERLFRSAGTSAHAVSAPLQRHWRDIHSMASHVVLGFDAAARAYADNLFARSDVHHT
ncbi:acyl-CoA dehydrogenase family protein [Actinoplanes sp. NPDC051475]|uniref:acyl-CoA dehydrogenase family protein n=1 Tax=Actinoplanes sp. NPDC051475 TaxID=3157225 RepID=UPI00344B36C5